MQRTTLTLLLLLGLLGTAPFAGAVPVAGICLDDGIANEPSASILATPAPEPGIAGMLGIALAGLLLRRPTRMRIPYL